MSTSRSCFTPDRDSRARRRSNIIAAAALRQLTDSESDLESDLNLVSPKNANSETKDPPNSDINWALFAEEIVARASLLDEEVAGQLVAAFSAVPRSDFIPAQMYQSQAAQDCALACNLGLSLPKPSIVARMLSLVGIRSGMRVLEVGCGTGYCSAVMASAGALVYAVENRSSVAQATRKHLDGLGFSGILIKRGDGMRGWLEYAPFDAIIVSEPLEQISQELIAQLTTPGGKLIAPIGDSERQKITLWEARKEGVSVYELEQVSILGQ